MPNTRFDAEVPTVHPVVDEVRQAVDRLAEVDWSGIPPGEAAEAVLALERARSVLGHAQLCGLQRLDDSGHCGAQGFRSVRAWLAHHARISPRAAGRHAADARSLPDMPLIAAAVAAGDTTLEHLAILRRALTPSRRAAFAEMEPTFLEVALTHPPAVLERSVRYWADAVDGAAADDAASALIARRAVHLSRCVDGMGRLDGDLDPESFAEVAGELDRLERQLFDADWRTARSRHGSAATVADLPRSPAQRRADALALMARRSASTPADARPPEPLAVVHVDWHTLIAELATHQPDHPYLAGGDHRAAAVAAAIRRGVDPAVARATAGRLCELDDGSVLAPSQALGLALRGQIQRIAFDPEGHVLDFGRRKRLFDGGLRQALVIRDRVCVEEGCDLPARHCEADHIVPWRDGGGTSEANGAMRCDHHNRRRSPGHRSRRRDGG